MDKRPKLPNYDPEYCRKVARCAASACVAVFVVEVIILSFVDPSAGRCPGWIVVGENPSETYLWVGVGAVTAPLMILMCYVALRWDQKFSQRMYDDIASRRPRFSALGFGIRGKPELRNANFEHIFFMDADKLFLHVSIAVCLTCALPLWLMLFKCTTLTRYLGY